MVLFPRCGPPTKKYVSCIWFQLCLFWVGGGDVGPLLHPKNIQNNPGGPCDFATHLQGVQDGKSILHPPSKKES